MVRILSRFSPQSSQNSFSHTHTHDMCSLLLSTFLWKESNARNREKGLKKFPFVLQRARAKIWNMPRKTDCCCIHKIWNNMLWKAIAGTTKWGTQKTKEQIHKWQGSVRKVRHSLDGGGCDKKKILSYKKVWQGREDGSRDAKKNVT